MTDNKLMTRMQVAEKIGVSRVTLYRELKEANIVISSRKLLRPGEYELIFRRFAHC